MGRDVAILLVFAMGSCAPTNTGSIGADSSIDLPEAWRSRTKLAVGKHWIEPGIARTQPIDARIPEGVRAVTAFLDLDDNNVIDPVVEPTAPCVRRGGRWSCRLGHEVLVSYRMDEVTEGVMTQFLVVPKIFESSAPAPAMVEGCVGDATGCNSPWVAVPWSAAEIRETSSCGESAPVVWWRPTGSLREGRSVEAPTPRPIIAEISVAPGVGDAIEIDVTTEEPTDRQILWIERDGAWIWSSEREPSAIDSSGPRVSVRIPPDVLEGCDECSAWLGLATQRHSSSDGVPVLEVSELRVDLRRGGFL